MNKFKTTEWTLNLHYAGICFTQAGRTANAKHCQEMLAWILRNIAAIEAIDGKPGTGKSWEEKVFDAAMDLSVEPPAITEKQIPKFWKCETCGAVNGPRRTICGNCKEPG